MDLMRPDFIIVLIKDTAVDRLPSFSTIDDDPMD